jgi:hypothetical protein
MNKFLIFAFNHYYPSGGLNDLQSTCDDYYEILDALSNLKDYEAIQVVNSDTEEVIKFFKYDEDFTDAVFEEKITYDFCQIHVT